MTSTQADREAILLGVLVAAADDFAVRALAQDVCRDRARPGTAQHHLHAHSATLWRQAEKALRAGIADIVHASPR